MASKPPFDATKAAFYLVAAVIGVHCVVVLSGMLFCSMFDHPERCSDLRGQLNELLTAALAAALAFAGGFRKDK